MGTNELNKVIANKTPSVLYTNKKNSQAVTTFFTVNAYTKTYLYPP